MMASSVRLRSSLSIKHLASANISSGTLAQNCPGLFSRSSPVVPRIPLPSQLAAPSKAGHPCVFHQHSSANTSSFARPQAAGASNTARGYPASKHGVAMRGALNKTKPAVSRTRLDKAFQGSRGKTTSGWSSKSIRGVLKVMLSGSVIVQGNPLQRRKGHVTKAAVGDSVNGPDTNGMSPAGGFDTHRDGEKREPGDHGNVGLGASSGGQEADVQDERKMGDQDGFGHGESSGGLNPEEPKSIKEQPIWQDRFYDELGADLLAIAEGPGTPEERRIRFNDRLSKLAMDMVERGASSVDPKLIAAQLLPAMQSLKNVRPQRLSDAERGSSLLGMCGQRFAAARNAAAMNRDRRNLPIYGKEKNGEVVVDSPGKHFAIRGEGTTMKAFLANLEEIYEIFVMSHDCPDCVDELRRELLYQHALTAPGLGKTTVLRHLPTSLKREHLDSLSPSLRRRLVTFRDKELVFRHNLKENPPYGPEQIYCPTNKTVLAARMLFAVLEREEGTSVRYDEFIEQFHANFPDLLQQLQPADVLRFIWASTGLEADQPGAIVFVWDDAQEAEGFVRTLMATYLETLFFPPAGRVEGATEEQSPHFVAMIPVSTRYGMGKLQGTPYSKARSKALPFRLLEDENIAYIVTDFMKRIGLENPGPIPEHVQVILDLLGGNPHLLEHALACMSGNSDGTVTVSRLISFWKSPTPDLLGIAECIAASGMPHFRTFLTQQQPPVSVLEAIFEYSGVNRVVGRLELVPGGSDARAFTWGDLEAAGMVALVNPYLVTTGASRGNRPLPRTHPRYQRLVVRMSSIMVLAYQEWTGIELYDQLCPVA